MQIIINLTDIKILNWMVDVEKAKVIVDFQVMKDNGQPYERLKATFWVTLPPDPDKYDYQLPSKYVTTLTELTNDARTALMNLIA